METTIFAGKGGVGKSTSSAAYALQQAESENVLLIDYDGGHSLTRVLAINQDFAANVISPSGIRNLYLSVIDDLPFEPIASTQARGIRIQHYLSQFPADYGLLPFCEMTTAFFGVPTDISSVSRFLSLVAICHEAKAMGIECIVIDAEPTAGLQRLLDSAKSISNSLCELQKKGWATIKMLGAKWPDISAFMQGSYIKNAQSYTDRMQEVAKMMVEARYIVVSIPESSPIAQMVDVVRLIATFGGGIIGYVINNIRHEDHEQVLIDIVSARANGRPVALIEHDRSLCDANSSERRMTLLRVGQMFAELGLSR